MTFFPRARAAAPWLASAVVPLPLGASAVVPLPLRAPAVVPLPRPRWAAAEQRARKSPQRKKGRRISGVERDEEEGGEAGRGESRQISISTIDVQVLPMKIK